LLIVVLLVVLVVQVVLSGVSWCCRVAMVGTEKYWLLSRPSIFASEEEVICLLNCYKI